MDEPNQKQAIIQAGSKQRDNKAESYASITVRKPKVRAYLNYLRDKSANKAIVSKSKVLKEVAKLAFTNIQDYVNIENDEVYFNNFKDIPREQLAAVKSVKLMRKIIKGKKDEDDIEVQQIGFELYSKDSALDKLMKHLGLYEKDNAQKAQSIYDILAIVGINGNGDGNKRTKAVGSEVV